MNSTEVASSPESSHGGQMMQLVRIQVFAFLTFILSFILFPLGIIRRRYNSSVLKAIAMGINAAIIALIPYVLGLMQSLGLRVRDEMVSFWAVFLFYLYFNVPSVLKLNDPLTVVMAHVKLYLYTYYVVSLHPAGSKHSVTRIGMFLINFASMFKVMGYVNVMRSVVTGDRLQALDMRRMSNSDGHGVGDALADPRRSNDDPWLRCNYIVYHASVFSCKSYSNDHRPGAVSNSTWFIDFDNLVRAITVHKIWSYEEEPGCLLSSSSSSSDDLKSYCLSFSLFQKLHSKFAGGIPYQSSHREEAWNFVRNGLLLADEQVRGSRCPFRVIETELAFLYDYLYNGTCCLHYVFGFPFIWLRYSLSLVGISMVLAATLDKNRAKKETVRIRYHKHDVDVLLTWIVIIASTLLEFMQLTTCLSSRWSKMMMLRLYLTRESWKRGNAWDRCINKAAQIILGSARGVGLFKPWQRQLGQYSLLDSYSYMQSGWMEFISAALYSHTGTRFLRPGRKQQSKSAPLTNEIKKAVIQTLLDRGHQLTNGIATLQASDELPLETKRKLAWACTQINTDAQVVLIWHIATSLCEIKWKQIPLEDRDDCDGDVNVATSLSKYCAYLVAFAPNMLPGHFATTDYTCSIAIENAYSCLKNCEASNIYDELMKITVDQQGVDIEFDGPNSQRDAASILQQGAVLGKVLVTKIEESRERWKVLAGFWAEMILYLAPNANNEWAHVESLADGGEFITHLWALLFHAGIIDRDSFSNRARDEEVDPHELHQIALLMCMRS